MLKCENLPRTNSTKYETQNILVKFQQNEHTPGLHVQIFHLRSKGKEGVGVWMKGAVNGRMRRWVSGKQWRIQSF